MFAMRVLLVAPHFSEYVSELAAELSARVDLLVGMDRTNIKAELTEAKTQNLRKLGFHLFTFRSSSFVSRMAAALNIVVRAAIFRPDIIHIQESGNKLVTLAGLILRPFGPIVLTVHDPLPHVGRDSTALKRWNARLMLRKASALCFAHGSYCQKELELPQAGAVSRIRSIYHGPIMIPLSEQKRPPCARKLLFFGRMEEYKGVEILLEACEILESRNVDFLVTIAGSGPELARLETRLSALQSIEVRSDWLSPEDAIEQFQKASLALLPYAEATQSGVLAAALANGRGVIASKIGGLTEIVEASQAGALVPPQDSLALADAIEYHLRSPEKSKLFQKAATDFVNGSMAWHSIADSTFRAYEEVLHNAKGL
jgi:glycosyltransferase involved in cell wall biosynthesis